MPGSRLILGNPLKLAPLIISFDAVFLTEPQAQEGDIRTKQHDLVEIVMVVPKVWGGRKPDSFYGAKMML